MNALKLTFLLMSIFLIGACGNDEEECAKADWLGTDSGTVDLDGTIFDATATIEDEGEFGIRFTWESAGGTAATSFPVTGCFVDRSSNDGVFNITYTLLLEGDKLSHTNNFEVVGGTPSNNTSMIFEGIRD